MGTCTLPNIILSIAYHLFLSHDIAHTPMATSICKYLMLPVGARSRIFLTCSDAGLQDSVFFDVGLTYSARHVLCLGALCTDFALSRFNQAETNFEHQLHGGLQGYPIVQKARTYLFS